MEKSEKIDFSKRPVDEKQWGGGSNPGCLFIFADGESADKDLEKVVAVKDDEEDISK